MKRQEDMRWTGALAAIVLLGLMEAALGQAPISEEARRLGQIWLLKNCDTAEQKRLEVELSRFRTELEPFFLEALRQGPESKLVSEVEQSAGRQFEQRQEVLKRRNPGLSEADLEIARKLTREQFTAQEKEAFVTRYKSQATAGLGVVGGEKAKAALAGIAQDEKSPLRGSAQEALKRLQAARRRHP